MSFTDEQALRATKAYIRDNASADVRALALKKAPAGVDVRWALQQIEGRQIATNKLPRWSAIDDLWFPPRLNLEQCSSEATAGYKRALAARLLGDGIASRSVQTDHSSLFIDLTAGYGVDFATMAPLFTRALYVERDHELCRLARHNMPLLGIHQAEIHEGQAEDMLATDFQADLIMIDPARRDAAGRKTVLIDDCTPDVCTLQAQLREHARYTIIKLSPMLDIKAALRSLTNVAEVHVVGSQGECKELLIVLRGNQADQPESSTPLSPEPAIYCSDDSHSFHFTFASEAAAPLVLAERLCTYIYEPSASVMKAGAFRTLSQLFPSLAKLAPATHLYTSDTLLPSFPGRAWRLIAHASFQKHELRRLLADIDSAELSVRGFPTSVAALRRQLHLRDGGTTHLIATTFADGSRHLLSVEQVCLK